MQVILRVGLHDDWIWHCTCLLLAASRCRGGGRSPIGWPAAWWRHLAECTRGKLRVLSNTADTALCVVAIQRNVFSCFVKYELKLKMFLLSVSCFRVRVGGLRCNKISIKRQIKFENEESDASQSVGVRHLLIGLWHFWVFYDFATRVDTQKYNYKLRKVLYLTDRKIYCTTVPSLIHWATNIFSGRYDTLSMDTAPAQPVSVLIKIVVFRATRIIG